jgi:glutathione S-transferase
VKTSQSDSETTVRITRVFRASRERVFSACLEPDELRRWWTPPHFEFTEITIDPATGRGRRFTMVGPAGERFVWEIEYTVVDRPSRLEWRSIPIEGFGLAGETRARLEFREVAEGTEVRLTHSGHPDAATRDAHLLGWGGGFGKLEALLAAR